MPFKRGIYIIKIICLWIYINIWQNYLYETFSKVKYIKSDYRSALTDKYLPSILMLENTNLEFQLSEMLPSAEKNSMLLILWSSFSCSQHQPDRERSEEPNGGTALALAGYLRRNTIAHTIKVFTSSSFLSRPSKAAKGTATMCNQVEKKFCVAKSCDLCLWAHQICRLPRGLRIRTKEDHLLMTRAA